LLASIDLRIEASAVSLFHSLIEALDQPLSVEGLGEEANGPSLEYARAGHVIWEGSNEYDRRVVALSD
jgi:hypothetical protein